MSLRNAPRIPEIGQRDRFIRRAVKDGVVYEVAGLDPAIPMPSRRYPGSAVRLFWSTPIEAKRWAKVLTDSDQTAEVPLADLVSTILPELLAQHMLVGVDWLADPVEAEVTADDLILRLKTEALDAHIRLIIAGGCVWTLEDDRGPVLQPSMRRPGSSAFHVWPQAAGAERQALRLSGVPRVVSDPLDDFLKSVVPWLAERGHMVGLEPIDGASALEIDAGDFAHRLAAAGLRL